MPSPFPGMDPYIEDPEVWSDFHADLAAEIRAALNQAVQPRYVARMIPRVTYELIEIGERRSVRPDVGIWQSQPTSGVTAGGTAVLAAAAPVDSLIPMEVPLRLYSVEVRETGTMRLVTAIEILSPVNKRPSHEAYHDYRRKRQEIFRSSAHLIEVDLLRGGERPPLEAPVPSAPYYITLSHADHRPHVKVWPIQLWEQLPPIPVPLLAPDPDVPLDLGAVVSAIYERGAYSLLIDYRQPPPLPALSDVEAAWVDEHLRARQAR